jgi:hypothetical protein
MSEHDFRDAVKLFLNRGDHLNLCSNFEPNTNHLYDAIGTLIALYSGEEVIKDSNRNLPIAIITLYKYVIDAYPESRDKLTDMMKAADLI